MNFAGMRQALTAPLLAGVGGAALADIAAHDELDHVVDKYNTFNETYQRITKRLPRVASAYEHIASQGPFSLIDGYGVLEILKGNTRVDYETLSDEDYQANPALRHAVAATVVHDKMTPEERMGIEFLFNKELELMGQERTSEFNNPGADYSTQRVIQAAEEGEGTSAVPALLGGLTGGGSAAISQAVARKLRAH
tara:strand:- start:1455 stop:2039 length:585 start_codon:yes stop_codon:yes gene_type:complete